MEGKDLTLKQEVTQWKHSDVKTGSVADSFKQCLDFFLF